MPPPEVPSEISSSLTNIFEANTPPLPEAFQDLDEDLPESAKTGQPKNSRQSRSKSGVIKRVDYKHLRKPGKTLLVTHNVFHAKRIPQSHTHMVQVLSPLANGDNMGLSNYSKPQNYWEDQTSSKWLSWKAAIDLDIQSFTENETWVLVPCLEDRFVISDKLGI